jgi:hypothetical protein
MAEASNQAMDGLRQGKSAEEVYQDITKWRASLESDPAKRAKLETAIAEGDPNFDPFGTMAGKREGGVDTQESLQRARTGEDIKARFEGVNGDVLQTTITLPDGTVVNGNKLHRGASADEINQRKGNKYGYEDSAEKFITETAAPADQKRLHDAGIAEIDRLLASRESLKTASPEQRQRAMNEFADAAYMLFHGPVVNRGSDSTIRVMLTAAFTETFGTPPRLPQDIDIRAYSKDQATFRKEFAQLLDDQTTVRPRERVGDDTTQPKDGDGERRAADALPERAGKPISPELQTKVEALKEGESVSLGKRGGKDGLVEFLRHQTVEYGVFRDAEGNYYVMRGGVDYLSPRNMTDRLVAHNHPGGTKRLSPDDIQYLHDSTDGKQRSTLLLTPGEDGGVARHRVSDYEPATPKPEAPAAVRKPRTDAEATSSKQINQSTELLRQKFGDRLDNYDTTLVPPPDGKKVLQQNPSDALIGLPADVIPATLSGADALTKLQQEGIPRWGGLTAKERGHESAFADHIEQNLPAALAEYTQRSFDQKVGTYIFEVDAAKKLYEAYGPAKAPEGADQLDVRASANHALHPAAVAVARIAFLSQLDTMSKLPDGDPRKSIFVTNGGCASGKGSLSEIVKNKNGGKFEFGAVWDAAGEGDAQENSWILQAAQARGLKVTYGMVESDPNVTYNGVLERADSTGRIVDPITFARSYVRGQENMRAVLDSPEYKAAVERGDVDSVGVYTGRFDMKTKSFPDSHLLGDEGRIGAEHLGKPLDETAVTAKAIEVFEQFLAKREAEGKATDHWFEGGAVNPLKFGDQPKTDTTPAMRAGHREALVEGIASNFHDQWRAPRLNKETGTYEPRVKKTKDAEWSAAHDGATEVDIANTKYSDLPSDWKGENKASAEVAVDLVLQAQGANRVIDAAFIEEASAVIHVKWLERNPWAEAHQKLPYDQLSEAEKQKDRDVVNVAIEAAKEKQKGPIREVKPDAADPAAPRKGSLEALFATNGKKLDDYKTASKWELESLATQLLAAKGIKEPTASQKTETVFQLDKAIKKGDTTFEAPFEAGALKKEDGVNDRLGNIFGEKRVFDQSELQADHLKMTSSEQQTLMGGFESGAAGQVRAASLINARHRSEGDFSHAYGADSWKNALRAETFLNNIPKGSFIDGLSIEVMTEVNRLIHTPDEGMKATALRTLAMVGRGFKWDKGGEIREGKQYAKPEQYSPEEIENFHEAGVRTKAFPFGMGTQLQYPDPAEVRPRMNKLIEELKAELAKPNADPIAAAAQFQRHFVALHPFGDSNGRTSRALMNRILLEFDMPPAIFADQNKDMSMSPKEWRDEVAKGVARSKEYLGQYSRNSRDQYLGKITSSSVIGKSADKPITVDGLPFDLGADGFLYDVSGRPYMAVGDELVPMAQLEHMMLSRRVASAGNADAPGVLAKQNESTRAFYERIVADPDAGKAAKVRDDARARTADQQYKLSPEPEVAAMLTRLSDPSALDPTKMFQFGVNSAYGGAGNGSGTRTSAVLSKYTQMDLEFWYIERGLRDSKQPEMVEQLRANRAKLFEMAKAEIDKTKDATRVSPENPEGFRYKYEKMMYDVSPLRFASFDEAIHELGDKRMTVWRGDYSFSKLLGMAPNNDIRQPDAKAVADQRAGKNQITDVYDDLIKLEGSAVGRQYICTTSDLALLKGAFADSAKSQTVNLSSLPGPIRDRLLGWMAPDFPANTTEADKAKAYEEAKSRKERIVATPDGGREIRDAFGIPGTIIKVKVVDKATGQVSVTAERKAFRIDLDKEAFLPGVYSLGGPSFENEQELHGLESVRPWKIKEAHDASTLKEEFPVTTATSSPVPPAASDGGGVGHADGEDAIAHGEGSPGTPAAPSTGATPAATGAKVDVETEWDAGDGSGKAASASACSSPPTPKDRGRPRRARRRARASSSSGPHPQRPAASRSRSPRRAAAPRSRRRSKSSRRRRSR